MLSLVTGEASPQTGEAPRCWMLDKEKKISFHPVSIEEPYE
jgi:hypothetical protein